jgi:hypothetical protein
MKHLNGLLLIAGITVITLCAIGLSQPAMSCDLSQAVIRAIWNEDTTLPVVKSVGSLEMSAAGERVAVVQFANGSWALVLVPQGVRARAKDVVELATDVTPQSFGDKKITVVKMLTSASAPSRFASCVADAGMSWDLN